MLERFIRVHIVAHILFKIRYNIPPVSYGVDSKNWNIICFILRDEQGKV